MDITAETTAPKRSRKAPQAEPAGSDGQFSRIVKRAPVVAKKDESAPKPMAAGHYRVIHGSICVPLPESSYTDANGQIIPHKPKFEYANTGDEVWLSATDATNAKAADLIEDLDAKPSRVGVVCAAEREERKRAARR